MLNFDKELNLAKKVAHNTAKLISENKKDNLKNFVSFDKDIKSKIDIIAHNYIIKELTSTGIPIVSEESHNFSFDINKFQWIIDPIDGTFNLIKGFEMSCISIALWDQGRPILGVIQNIFSNKIYFSLLNKGSWENDRKINVSNQNKKNEAVLATGFPSNRNYQKSSLDRFYKKIQKYKKIRMIGSAALMLCYVACGFFDKYYEEDIFIWDVAAGLSIVTEAGGHYIIEKGSTSSQFNVKAANKYLIK